MARPPRFTDDDILDGAARALTTTGETVTISDIAREIHGPSGSIYHRFPSRDDLLGSLWLRSIGRFHEGLLKTLSLPDPQEAIEASARHVVAFCREHPLDARALTLYRQPQLAASGPLALRAAATRVNEAIDAASVDLAARRFGETTARRHEILRVATRLSPYGLVRPFIGREIPPWLEEAAGASARAICVLGDDDHPA